MTIYVRDDDVLIDSSGCEDAFERFKTIHGWICETDKMLHIPTLLVHNRKDTHRGLLGFPEALEFIKAETEAGRMWPEIHGYEHIDYGKLPKDEVLDHLYLCQDFFDRYIGRIPTRWYTPWGASQPHLHDAACEAGLKLVDCSQINELQGEYGVIQRIIRGEKPEDFLEEKEIFLHWWKRGWRLRRVVEVLKHGSWGAAKEANGKWFE